MLKWPGQIAVHSAKRPVAKYTREEGKSREEFQGKDALCATLKAERDSRKDRFASVCEFQPFPALTESLLVSRFLLEIEDESIGRMDVSLRIRAINRSRD